MKKTYLTPTCVAIALQDDDVITTSYTLYDALTADPQGGYGDTQNWKS